MYFIYVHIYILVLYVHIYLYTGNACYVLFKIWGFLKKKYEFEASTSTEEHPTISSCPFPTKNWVSIPIEEVVYTRVYRFQTKMCNYISIYIYIYIYIVIHYFMFIMYVHIID